MFNGEYKSGYQKLGESHKLKKLARPGASPLDCVGWHLNTNLKKKQKKKRFIHLIRQGLTHNTYERKRQKTT